MIKKAFSRVPSIKLWADVHLLSTYGEHTGHYSELFPWITSCNPHNPIGGKWYYESYVKGDNKLRKVN